MGWGWDFTLWFTLSVAPRHHLQSAGIQRVLDSRPDGGWLNLAGVNPIRASSGNTVRHRINRGGDRRLNRALHMAIVTRMRMDPDTPACIEKRTAGGHTMREIRRSLKRYLAGQIYRHLSAATAATSAA